MRCRYRAAEVEGAGAARKVNMALFEISGDGRRCFCGIAAGDAPGAERQAAAAIVGKGTFQRPCRRPPNARTPPRHAFLEFRVKISASGHVD